MSPLERYFKLPQEKRDRLVAAARAEFAAHGFERASYNRIIEAADVSKGAMYYYFIDKADLFGEVIDQLMVELVSQVGPLRQAQDADDFWTALWEWMMAATQAVLSSPDFAALGHCLYQDGGPHGAVTRLREQLHAVAAETLERGQELGAVRTDVPTEMLAVGLTHMLLGLDRWFTERFEQMKPSEVEHLSGKTLELCRDLAAPKPVAKAAAQPKRRKRQ